MNVVVVDDDQTNIFVTEAMVRSIAGCRATSFTDSLKAFHWCSANPFDLLIIDYLMPLLNGIDFIAGLRADPRLADVPVLMVTGRSERAVLHRAFDAGATDFLTKPVDGIEFGARVRNLLLLHKSRTELADRARTLAAEVQRATADILNREQDTVIRLCKAAEFRDPTTGAHIQRMARYSRLIADELTHDAAFCSAIFEAAPMHDVGKLGTPDHILLKPGKLTPEEYKVMQEHARIGWTILKDGASPVLHLAAQIAYAHHEKFDGSGYPVGLAGDAIPLGARIVAVADVFDALTHARPYKPAWDIEQASAYVRGNRGTQFDPACVDAFFARWDEIARICQTHHDEIQGAGDTR